MDMLAKAPCPLLVTDLLGDMLAASQDMVQEVLGTDDWPGKNMEAFLPPASRVFMQTHIWPTLFRSGQILEAHLKLRDRDGQTLPALVNARVVNTGGTAQCVWVFFIAHNRSQFESELIQARTTAQQLAKDLASANAELLAAQAELRQQALAVEARNEELKWLSETDALTGLGNRRRLDAAFAAWRPTTAPTDPTVGSATAASLLLVDADHFKRVNDHWGHEEGDRVLVLLAQSLQASVRHNDTVIRQGGEEFIIFLPGADTEAALRVADKVHAAVKAIRPGHQPEALTVSIGVATHRATASNLSPSMWLEALVRQADAATYEAKAKGRNRTVLACGPLPTGPPGPQCHP